MTSLLFDQTLNKFKGNIISILKNTFQHLFELTNQKESKRSTILISFFLSNQAISVSISHFHSHLGSGRGQLLPLDSGKKGHKLRAESPGFLFILPTSSSAALRMANGFAGN